MNNTYQHLKPIVENEVLKVFGDGEIEEYSTLQVNDEFNRKGTKVKLIPNTQRGKKANFDVTIVIKIHLNKTGQLK